MNKKKLHIDYLTALKYLAVFLSFLIFSNIETKSPVYSTAVYACLYDFSVSPIFTPLLFLTSFAITKKLNLLLAMLIPTVVIDVIYLIYKKFGKIPKYEVAIYVAVCLVCYIFLEKELPLERKILSVVFTSLFTLVFKTALSATVKKGLKFKWGYEETATLSLSIILFGLGLSNLISPLVFKSLAVLIILLSAYLFRSGISTVVSAVLGISLSIYFNNLNYISVFILFSVACESFMPYSRFLSAITLSLVDYAVFFIFNVYPSYEIADFISTVVGVALFIAIPTKALVKIKEKLSNFREKQLVRQTINRNRIMTSNRLYEISNVFSEMANAFYTFQKKSVSEDSIKSLIESQTVSSVCLSCSNKEKCKEKKNPKQSDVDKLLDIGFAKGKISLVDIPNNILKTCIRPNDFIFSVNKLLSDYRLKKADELSTEKDRELIAKQADGVAEILRKLAFETGTLLKYQNTLERNLAENLFKAGFNVSEILIYGEEDSVSAGLIVTMKDFSIQEIQNVVNETVKVRTSLAEKIDIADGKCYLSFKKAPNFDAEFGIASAVKDDSDACGDCHSVMRIKDDKFLVAVSDGMGSGKNAQTVSSSSLSLIECFYKAGISGETVLETVNKLLAINTEDAFTALDIAVIDLKNPSADFIKYGSPYGFILSDNQIKIVEGSSLPLGILEELTPAVCTSPLCDGDIILLLSDGISDAFGSSGDIIEYLRTAPAFNPQVLTDDLLKKAIEKNGGVKKDDMTALAVKICQVKKTVV